MLSPIRTLLVVSLLFVASITSKAQSACAGNTLGCSGTFTGMLTFDSSVNALHSSSPYLTFNAAAFNDPSTQVSLVNVHTLFAGTPFSTSPIFVNFLPWFGVCATSGTPPTFPRGGPNTSAPPDNTPYTSCAGHIETGYNSNNSTTIQNQLGALNARGFDGLIIDWNGPTHTSGGGVGGTFVDDTVTQGVMQQLDSTYCPVSGCLMHFAIMEDQTSWKTHGCVAGKGQPDQTPCIISALENDFDYIKSTYLSAPSYLRVSNHQLSASGNPVYLSFYDSEGWMANFTTVWTTFQAYASDSVTGVNPAPLLLFRNADGFSTPAATNGGYAWFGLPSVNAANPPGTGTSDTDVKGSYLFDFFQTANNSPGKEVWGSLYKGFDNRMQGFSPAEPDKWINPLALESGVNALTCGTVWLDSAKVPASAYTGTTPAFFQVATWNDYDEGTEIESGIDNCISSIAPAVDNTGANLTWTTTFSENNPRIPETINSYDLTTSKTFEGNGVTVVEIDDIGSLTGSTCNLVTGPPLTHQCSIPISQLPLAPGTYSVGVRALGKPSIISRTGSGVQVTVPNPTGQWNAQNAQLGHATGFADGDGWSADYSVETANWLQYGPYTTTMTVGANYATWNLSVSDTSFDPRFNANVGELQVYDSTANAYLGTLSLNYKDFPGLGAYKTFTVPFDLDSANATHQLEFRVWWAGNTYMTEEWVGWSRQIPGNAVQRWPAKDVGISHVIGRPDGDGWSATVGVDSVNWMQYGPYTTTVTAGANLAVWRLWIDNNTTDNNQIVDLDVNDATAGTVLASRTVTRQQWAHPGEYENFVLPFTLPSGSVGHQIEYRVYWYGNAYVKEESLGFNN